MIPIQCETQLHFLERAAIIMCKPFTTHLVYVKLSWQKTAALALAHELLCSCSRCKGMCGSVPHHNPERTAKMQLAAAAAAAAAAAVGAAAINQTISLQVRQCVNQPSTAIVNPACALQCTGV